MKKGIGDENRKKYGKSNNENEQNENNNQELIFL